jgi:hypothetical protein
MNEAPLLSWNTPLRIVYLNLPLSVQQVHHDSKTTAEFLHTS